MLEIGGFDETFAYFLDETDVCLRLHDSGRKIRFAPGAEILHKYAPSAQRNTKRIPHSLYLPARSKAYFVWRHARGLFPESKLKRHLDFYKKELMMHNRIMLLNKEISRNHFDRLGDDIERGLKEGTRLAHKTDYHPFPKLLSTQEPSGNEFAPAFGKERARPVLRLIIIAPNFFGSPENTVARAMQAMADVLSKCGHEVYVITNGARNDVFDFENGFFVSRIAAKSPTQENAALTADLPPALAADAWSIYMEARRLYWEAGCDLAIWDPRDLAGLALARTKLLPTAMLASDEGVTASAPVKAVLPKDTPVIGFSKAAFARFEHDFGVRVPQSQRYNATPFDLNGNGNQSTRHEFETVCLKIIEACLDPDCIRHAGDI